MGKERSSRKRQTNLTSLGGHTTEVGIAQGGLRLHLPLALNILLDNRDPLLGRNKMMRNWHHFQLPSAPQLTS